jgi:hypothetical protein
LRASVSVGPAPRARHVARWDAQGWAWSAAGDLTSGRHRRVEQVARAAELESGRWRLDEWQRVAQAGELEYPLHARRSLDQSQFPFRRAGGRVGLEDEVQPG